MQLDLFAAAQPAEPSAVPDIRDLSAAVGSVTKWATLTLSDVLELWGKLYDDFIGKLDEAIAEAKVKREEAQGTKQKSLVSFYRQQYDRLVLHQHQLRAAAENMFCDNMSYFIAQGKAFLQEKGMSEDDAEAGEEFFNDVFQRPASHDLGKLMPMLMEELATEYLKRT